MRLKAERYEKLRKGEEAPSKESAIDVSRSETTSSLVASVYPRISTVLEGPVVAVDLGIFPADHSSWIPFFTQFDRKQEEEEGYDHWSDHASDVDESALVPDHLKHLPPQSEYTENDVSDANHLISARDHNVMW
jgi:hypothetical protein